jgi:WD40 repeat protein
VDIIKDLKIDVTYTAMKFLGSVNKLAFDASGRFLAAASEEDSVSIFDITNTKTYVLRPGHTAPCVNVVFHPDSKYICSTSRDRSLRLYDIINLEHGTEEPKFISSFPLGKKGEPVSVEQNLQAAWDPLGTKLALPGENRLVLITEGTWATEPLNWLTHDKVK